MSVPSMVHRSGDTLVVRSVVSGDALFDHQQSADKKQSALSDLPECKVKRNYSCSRCEFFTQNPRSFLYHLRDVHKEKVRIYECPNCLYASKHYQKLLRHTKMVHGSSKAAAAAKKRPVEEDDNNSDCTDAKESDKEDSGNNNNANVSKLKCTICSFVAKSNAQLTRHEREEHIKSKFYRCTKCTYATHMKARFTKHVKYHSMPMIKCDMCDFRTPYKWNLDRHCKNHNGRGGFRCSACNFTADIKQSLTVHEMNHHVPPVGQAGGLGVGRRRNKVGASDSAAAEDNLQGNADGGGGADHQQHQQQQQHLTATSGAINSSNNGNNSNSSNSSGKSSRTKEAAVSDFVHPDDIVQHANGKVYIKSKCRFCSFKSAWESEMLRHEQNTHPEQVPGHQMHNNNNNNNNNNGGGGKKRTARPVPDLIPIKERRTEPPISNTDMNKILNNCKNSSLRDFAPLFNSEDVFQKESVPQQQQQQTRSGSGSFFDKFSFSATMEDLCCSVCGHRSKCLTEHAAHTKSCGGKLLSSSNSLAKISRLSSTRCQYCRQRCKSSKDLLQHLNTCREYLQQEQQQQQQQQQQQIKEESLMMMMSNMMDEGVSFYNNNALDNNNLATGTDGTEEKKPHPMENKVFIWNKTEESFEESSFDLVEEQQPQQDTDQYSLDYSINTQSPNSESSSSLLAGANNNNNYEMIFAQQQQQQQQQQQVLHAKTSSGGAGAGGGSGGGQQHQDKIPTHGNDISVAQHKRVFKCPHCTFWASTASRFHVHIVGHLNKKPFECSLCSYRSNWRWDITKHIKLKSVRDPEHEGAKVLMTDETGRRNYTKYNKYLTEIPSNGQDALETSGGMGTRPRDKKSASAAAAERPSGGGGSTTALRPPPQLKPADAEFFSKMAAPERNSRNSNKSSPSSSSVSSTHQSPEGKKTLWQCKRCSFRDPSKEKLLQHVKVHLGASPSAGGGGGSIATARGTPGTSAVGLSGGGGLGSGSGNVSSTLLSDLESEASVGGGGPARGQFRCGHCHQVSNWKHVIQRHCRLKHGGDVKVLVGKDRIIGDSDALMDDGVELCQEGGWKCMYCPFVTDDSNDYYGHLEGHVQGVGAANNNNNNNNDSASPIPCAFCTFTTTAHDDLFEHLKSHGVMNELFAGGGAVTTTGGGGGKQQLGAGQEGQELSKRYKCSTCPYVTNSKSQFTYHKQFHETKSGQYRCTECSYNVSKRHLLHQHLKVHGISVSPQKQNGELLELEDISDEIEEVHTRTACGVDWRSLSEIPLVWFSKGSKYSKMYKCRYCPHVNLRKVNIQEHEKMHRERNNQAQQQSSARFGDRDQQEQHRCPVCNYVCNNAGVLSSHNKVHQALYGTVHGLVDASKSDEEQIRELAATPNPLNLVEACYPTAEDDEGPGGGQADVSDMEMLNFCSKCPARFFNEKEFRIHAAFHRARLPFKCEHCTYATKQKTYLLAHEKVHSEEYQQRSKELMDTMNVNTDNQQPQLVVEDGGAWVVASASGNEDSSEEDYECRRMQVPLSGTDLFQQKSEVENGTRNGRIAGSNTKEKKHKCTKCPNAFEKKEQFRHHMALHGSNQQFTCTYCDYSVANYANFVQHERKHKSQLQQLETEANQVEEGSDTEQQQTALVPEKKPYGCTMCPYSNSRRDAVDNHQRRHIKLSGIENAYTCQHCDYSVPQMHYLKDHTRLHFQPLKTTPVDGGAAADGAQDLQMHREHLPDEQLRYDLTNEDAAGKLNNNDGEKIFVDTETGKVVVEEAEDAEAAKS